MFWSVLWVFCLLLTQVGWWSCVFCVASITSEQLQRYQRHYGTWRQDVDAWHNSDVSTMRRLWSSTFWSCILILPHIVSHNSFEKCSKSPVFRYTGTADYCSMGAVMSFQPMSPQVSRCSEEESLGALQDLRKTSTKAGHAHTIGICWCMLIHGSDLCSFAMYEMHEYLWVHIMKIW